MKKLFFSLLALAAVSISFVSCKDDVDLDLGPSHKDQPAAAFVGTYNGTWTQQYTDTKTNEVITTTSSGSVTIASGENNNTAVITLANASDANINNLSSIANISWRNDGVEIFNGLMTNGLGTPFMGEITENKSVNLKFAKTVRSGRSTLTMFYQFVTE